MRKILYVIAFLGLCSISPAQITLSVNQQNVQCFGMANGSATVTPNGGTPAYSYTWLPGGQTTASTNNLAAGTYTVYVQDAAAATASLVVTITEFPLLVITTTHSNVSCGGGNDGVIQISGSGGSGAVVSYLTSSSSGPIAVVPTVYHLSAGVYTCSITDANGCIATETVSITQPMPFTASITHTNASCNGACDGSVVIGVTGGIGPYTYSSQPPGISIGNTTNICAGTYTVITTDANGCMYGNMLLISNTGSTSLPNATVTSVSYNESCYLSADGAIDVTITGSNPGPFTYQWSNGATTQDLNNITTNQYQLTITDAGSNCMTLWDTISSAGINCGTISGNAYIDNNGDCTKNSGDYNSNGTQIIINPGNRIGYTNLQGDYIINDLPYGTYSVSLNTTNTHLSATCSATLQASVNSGMPNFTNADLSLGFSSAVQPDIEVTAFSNPVVPGFQDRINYTLSNLTNVQGTGLLKVTLPSTFMATITGISPSTYTVSGDTIIWNYNSITYYNNASFYIDFITPVTATLGSLFESCASIQTTITDLDPSNNTYCYQRMITGSFDPNDKTVSPVGIGAGGDIPTSVTDLTYLIRFQNTGNGPAVNIVVKDTLSANVDISTLEMISASHNYSIDILDGNVLRWKFNNIMLPDSNSNEPGSHGYIQYRIKRNNNNAPGTQIKNTAYIYFDFNEPVVTNTALNTIETITSAYEKTDGKANLFVYPNPAKDLLNINLINFYNKEKLYVKITDIVGREVLITDYKEQLNISSLEKGIYFISIQGVSGILETKKINKE